MVLNDLLTLFKARFSKFACSIVDEDLIPTDTTYLVYKSPNPNWLTTPAAEIRSIDVNGVDKLLFPTLYTITAATGIVTFTTARASTDIIRASYSIAPFSDSEITSILNSALIQIRVLVFHDIVATNFSENYSEAILKRAYTIALRELQFPTTKYFAISIAGRTIDKSTQVAQIEALITSNEKDLLQDVNAIRYFDRTNILS